MRPDRLSNFPYVIVRLRCDVCGRRGSAKLARLAAKYGAERSLDEVLDALAADCPARVPPREISSQGWKFGCGARFADLDDGPSRPPDIPASMRRPRLVRTG